MREERECIYLIGFMGTGKTTVAKALQKRTGWQTLDTDDVIEMKTGRKIADIFRDQGEEEFRRMETEVLREVSRKGKVIVACGGGVALREENREIMRRYGKVFLLTAKPETVLQRVRNDQNRPLLKGKKNAEAISQMMETRRFFYEQAADFHIPVDGRRPTEIAGDIIARMGI